MSYFWVRTVNVLVMGLNLGIAIGDVMHRQYHLAGLQLAVALGCLVLLWAASAFEVYRIKVMQRLELDIKTSIEYRNLIASVEKVPLNARRR